MEQVKIAHLTTVHPRGDTRIRIREVGSIANALDGPVALLVQDGRGNSVEEGGKIRIIDTGPQPPGRLARMTLGVFRMWRAVRLARPRLVHFHDPELIPLGMILKCFGHRVVYDVHEDLPRQVLTKYWLPGFARRPVSWVVSVIEWLAARVFDAIISVTPKIAERFPPRKTSIVQNFPIPSELVVTEGVPYKQRPPHFAYVGGITRIRGIHEMIDAMTYTDRTGNKDILIRLAGTFQPFSLQSEIEALAGWQRVDFLGWVGRVQVAEILSNALAGLVLFLPAPNHMDAYPNKMFEYMSASLPVIVSDFPLWRHIVESAGCGLLVDPMNPRAIADAMLWILEHPDEAAAMGQRGRLAVEKHYNWDSEADKLVTLYKKLLAT
ncbi:MAG: glycosyltransferase family 4 protein [Gammaproteobacteria bacterium]|nr:glycosyltransferase family 4 protein [Gammaproteobacteria bacterium]